MAKDFLDAVKSVFEIISTIEPKSVICTRVKNNPWGEAIFSYLKLKKLYDSDRSLKYSLYGVEPYENALSNSDKNFYKTITPGDPYEFLPVCTKADLVIIYDVLEYMDKRKAIKIIQTAQQKGDHTLFFVKLNQVVNPKPKDDPFSSILSSWKVEDFLMRSKVLSFNNNKGEEIGIFYYDNLKNAKDDNE